MDDGIYDAVRRLAADAFDVPETDIGPTTSPETLPEWDSLQHLNLMMAIEDAFAIEVNPDDFETMTDIQSIVAYVAAARPS